MGTSGKKRTTMAKLNRESKLRDKRAEKEARKAARKFTAARDAASRSDVFDSEFDAAPSEQFDAAPSEDLAQEGAASPQP